GVKFTVGSKPHLPLPIEESNQALHALVKSLNEFITLQFRQSLKHGSKLGEIKRRHHRKRATRDLGSQSLAYRDRLHSIARFFPGDESIKDVRDMTTTKIEGRLVQPDRIVSSLTFTIGTQPAKPAIMIESKHFFTLALFGI